MPSDPKRNGLVVTSVLLGLMGLVWFGQGVGLIPGSFMSGDPTWAWIGGTLVAVSVGMAVWARRSG